MSSKQLDEDIASSQLQQTALRPLEPTVTLGYVHAWICPPKDPGPSLARQCIGTRLWPCNQRTWDPALPTSQHAPPPENPGLQPHPSVGIRSTTALQPPWQCSALPQIGWHQSWDPPGHCPCQKPPLRHFRPSATCLRIWPQAPEGSHKLQDTVYSATSSIRN